jgi:hypothetical protein
VDDSLEVTHSPSCAMPAPFRCDLTAIPPAERAAHEELIRRLVSETVETMTELPDGVAFGCAADAYERVVRFVALERLCCPFLTFTLAVTPERGPLSLRLTGPEGVTAFLEAELGLPPRSARPPWTA